MPLTRLQMPADNSRMGQPQQQTQILKRIAITVGLGIAFIMMASIFTPDRSRASDDLPRNRTPRARAAERADAAPSADAHEGLNSLGVFETGRYAIAIYSTDLGPRYTIIARDSGEELGTLLTSEQVQQLLPEIDLNAIDFSATSDTQQTLMLAEPQA